MGARHRANGAYHKAGALKIILTSISLFDWLKFVVSITVYKKIIVMNMCRIYLEFLPIYVIKSVWPSWIITRYKIAISSLFATI